MFNWLQTYVALNVLYKDDHLMLFYVHIKCLKLMPPF